MATENPLLQNRVLGQPQEPSIGAQVSPPALVQGAPPRDENEFNSFFQQTRQYLNRPDIKAALLQFAIANLQPRQPGVPDISAIANAVGSGAQAASRVQIREEEQRRQESKEAREEQRIGLEERRVSTLEKSEERQRVQGSRRLDILKEANDIARLRTRAVASGNTIQLKKLAEMKRQFDAELALKGRQIEVNAQRWAADRTTREKIADKTFDRTLVTQAMNAELARAKQAHQQLLKELENRELTKEGSKERAAIDKRINQLAAESVFNMGNAETNLDRLRRLGQAPTGGGEPSERGGSVPGVPGSAGSTGARRVDDAAVNQAIRLGRASSVLELAKRGEISISPEARQAAEQAAAKRTTEKRASIEELNVTQLESKFDPSTRRGQRAIPANPGEEAMDVLTKTGTYVRTREDFSRLSEDAQSFVINSLSQIFDKEKPPTDDQLWQLVLTYSFLQEYVRERYGADKANELMSTVRQNLEQARSVRRQKEAAKERSAQEQERIRQRLNK